MNELDHIAIRVIRDGKPVSAFVSDLEYMTGQELSDLPICTYRAIAKALTASNKWGYNPRHHLWVNAALFGKKASVRKAEGKP